MKAFQKVLVPAVVLAVIGLTTVLYAQQSLKGGSRPAQEALLKTMADHKMTLVSAIEAAEKDTKGQALSASAKMQETGAVVLVTCAVGDATKHVQVDVATGKVTESAPRQKTGTTGTSHGKHENTPKKKP